MLKDLAHLIGYNCSHLSDSEFFIQNFFFQKSTPSDEVDSVSPVMATAPNVEDLEGPLQISGLILEESTPTAPVIEGVLSRAVTISPEPQLCEVLTTKFETELSINATKNLIPFTEAQLATLYSNEELNLVEPFVNDFVESQLRSHLVCQEHRLHDLLMRYLRVRNHLMANFQELEQLKKSCKETQKQLWCLDKAWITESGECQDGNPVSATHEYSVAHFNQQNLTALSRGLSAIKESLHQVQALHCYESETLRLHIEHYVQRVCLSCKEFAGLPHNAPIVLNSIPENWQSSPQLIELRTCITILFNFQRKVLRDEKFVSDSREWLGKLIGVLLRIANWQDHLFLLNHIIRCPGGVANWARSFIQVPVPGKTKALSTSPLSDPCLDHMIATLAVILLPIKEREKFLTQVNQD